MYRIKQNLNEILFFLLKIFFVSILSMIVFVIYYRLKHKRFYHLVGKLPGPLSIPIIGNLYMMPYRITDGPKLVLDFGKKYGSPSKIMLSELPIVVVNKPEHFQIVLNSSIDRGYIMRKTMRPFLGDSLFITNNWEKWRKHRKMFSLALTPTILESFLPVFQNYARSIEQKLELKVGNEKPFDIWDYISPANLEIVTKTSMGLNIDLKSDAHSFLEAIDNVILIMAKRCHRSWLLFNPIFKRTSYYKKQNSDLETIFNIINMLKDEKLKYIKKETNQNDNNNEEKFIEKNPQKKVFLDLLFDIAKKDPSLSSKDLFDDILLFFFASYHTSAGTMCFLLLNLAFHQNVQEKVYQELNNIFGDSEREPSLEDFSKMKYLEQCILESLRTYPIAPADFRCLNKDITIDDYLIPKGTTICLNYYSMFHSDIWKNPENFEPERFSPENIKNIHPYALLQFGGGLKFCLGRRYAIMSMKTILSRILRKYKVTTPLKKNELLLEFSMFITPVQGFKINVEKRF